MKTFFLVVCLIALGATVYTQQQKINELNTGLTAETQKADGLQKELDRLGHQPGSPASPTNPLTHPTALASPTPAAAGILLDPNHKSPLDPPTPAHH